MNYFTKSIIEKRIYDRVSVRFNRIASSSIGPGFISISPHLKSNRRTDNIEHAFINRPLKTIMNMTAKNMRAHLGIKLTRVLRLIHTRALKRPTAALN